MVKKKKPDFFEDIGYCVDSIPAAPLLKSMRNSVGFCFYGGFVTGIEKRVFPHLLRHSDAIIRLCKTGNPKALQYHLGHNTPAMTLRYLSTLTQEDALRVQQEVRFEE